MAACLRLLMPLKLRPASSLLFCPERGTARLERFPATVLHGEALEAVIYTKHPTVAPGQR